MAHHFQTQSRECSYIFLTDGTALSSPSSSLSTYPYTSLDLFVFIASVAVLRGHVWHSVSLTQWFLSLLLARDPIFVTNKKLKKINKFWPPRSFCFCSRISVRIMFVLLCWVNFEKHSDYFLLITRHFRWETWGFIMCSKIKALTFPTLDFTLRLPPL